MKIGILTQPLHNNYGGLLQSYALKKILRNMGHEIVIINRCGTRSTKLRRLASKIKQKLNNYLYFSSKSKVSYYRPSISEEEIISKNSNYFKNKYIGPLTKEIRTNKGMKAVTKYNFDAYIVGSDQVWRPCYSPSIKNYFFDFLREDVSAKRIAYAASFGVSDWEFDKKNTIKCGNLARKFDAVSVREDSGVDLCREYLGVEARHVLDPTMLLRREDYLELIESEKEPPSQGDLMTYVLDESQHKIKLVNVVSSNLNLVPFTVMPKVTLNRQTRQYINDCIYPPVTQWLRGFKDAKFIVTDSFHGCVFSILFRKPFVAIANSKRGSTRFESLLSLLGLEDRLMKDIDELNLDFLNREIAWDRVHALLEKERIRSLDFLKSNLCAQ